LDIVYRDVANDGIYVFRADGLSEPKRINHDLTRCNHPQWSPDGTKIAFACNGTIYSVSPDGASLTPLVDGGVYLRWSPDGQRIAFIGTKVLDASLGKTLDIEGTIESTAVFIMDANGTNIKRITSRNDESIGWLTWIPAVQGKK
jgi:Tol biopolymer transport system component